jgi:hypothetical protein
MSPSVACIVPTYGRQDLYPQLYTVFCAQRYEPKALWILDDSPARSFFFDQVADPRVRYTWDGQRRSIGAKRNMLAAMCGADVIAHFDDDDFYHADYLPAMMMRLGVHDLIKLSCWDALNAFDGAVYRWDTQRGGGPCFMVTGGQPATAIPNCPRDPAAIDAATWGYGFSYVYRRSVWQRQPFPNINLGEDLAFIQGIKPWARMALVADAPSLVLHTIHPKSTSRIYPQQCISPAYTVVGAPKQKKGKGRTMTLTAGVPVEVVALVKNSHSIDSLRERALGYGVQVETATDDVDARSLGLRAPKKGYRYVTARLRPSRHVTMRSSAPPPFSWHDKTAVVRVRPA